MRSTSGSGPPTVRPLPLPPTFRRTKPYGGRGSLSLWIRLRSPLNCVCELRIAVDNFQFPPTSGAHYHWQGRAILEGIDGRRFQELKPLNYTGFPSYPSHGSPSSEPTTVTLGVNYLWRGTSPPTFVLPHKGGGKEVPGGKLGFYRAPETKLARSTHLPLEGGSCFVAKWRTTRYFAE